MRQDVTAYSKRSFSSTPSIISQKLNTMSGNLNIEPELHPHVHVYLDPLFQNQGDKVNLGDRLS